MTNDQLKDMAYYGADGAPEITETLSSNMSPEDVREIIRKLFPAEYWQRRFYYGWLSEVAHAKPKAVVKGE